MGTKSVVLGFVGSPNKEGRTNQLVTAALEGAAEAGRGDMAMEYGLAKADALAAAGRDVESLSEITRVYEAGVTAFEAD